jgi:hypothetical protein
VIQPGQTANNEERKMRGFTRNYLAQLPARKRVTLFVLCVLMCGGMVAGGALS